MSFFTLRISIDTCAPEQCLIGSVLFNTLYSCLQGQGIALGTQSADHALGNIREIGVMAKRLPLVHVGKMHFDEWDAHRQQCVTYCDTGVGKSCRVDDDETDGFVPCCMDTVDQLVLGIALQSL